MKISILVLSYNGEQFIENSINSILKNLPKESEIIVVDNGSQDKTVEIIKKFKDIQLIENSQNLGFSTGFNIAAKQAKGEYLLFLNQDVKVIEDGINKLLDFIQDYPEYGIAAPKLIEPSGKTQESVSKFPTLSGAVKEYVFGQKNAYSQYIPSGNDPVDVDVVYGAVVLIKKEIFEKVGKWNERYFLYYEDIDLCYRVHKAGLKIAYLPTIEFSHLLGASAKKAGQMPFGIRTLSWFWPIKKSGSRYFMIKSARIYHGVAIATLIRLLMYVKTKIERSI